MTQRERIGEFEIAFEEAGRGVPVVLLNPFPFDRRVWTDNVPALLEAGCRVIRFDYPGFGPAAPAGAVPAYSIAGLADGVLALCDRLQVQAPVLLGMSMGGYVALAVAARAPDRLAGLILADTRANADDPATRAGRADALATIRDRGVDAYLERSLPRLLAPDVRPEMLARAHALAERRAPALTAGIAALRDRPDRTAELPRLAVPTLVVVGTHDQISPPPVMHAMAAAIPGARAVEMAGAGHLSNLEAPAAFNQAVCTFVAGLAAPGAREVRS